MKKLLLLLIIPLLFSCNSKKEKNSFVGIWTEQAIPFGDVDLAMNIKYTLFSNGSYSLYTTMDGMTLKSLITGTWEEKNGQICFSDDDDTAYSWCYDYLWLSINQWEYTTKEGDVGILTRQ